MTTAAAAELYETQHVLVHQGRGYVVFNPKNKPVADLPVIFGFNNGGSSGWMQAVLIAQDGTMLGSHICSSEAYMRADLGVLEGTRPDRHEDFQKHYPGGYRMDFVSYDDAPAHAALDAAFAANKAQEPKEATQA